MVFGLLHGPTLKSASFYWEPNQQAVLETGQQTVAWLWSPIILATVPCEWWIFLVEPLERKGNLHLGGSQHSGLSPSWYRPGTFLLWSSSWVVIGLLLRMNDGLWRFCNSSIWFSNLGPDQLRCHDLHYGKGHRGVVKLKWPIWKYASSIIDLSLLYMKMWQLFQCRELHSSPAIEEKLVNQWGS